MKDVNQNTGNDSEENSGNNENASGQDSIMEETDDFIQILILL